MASGPPLRLLFRVSLFNCWVSVYKTCLTGRGLYTSPCIVGYSHGLALFPLLMSTNMDSPGLYLRRTSRIFVQQAA